MVGLHDIAGAKRVEQPGPSPAVYLAYSYAGSDPRRCSVVGFSSG